MNITEEVRDFAAKQNVSADTFSSAPAFAGEGDHVQHGGASAEAEAEKGMAEMSEKFREIDLPAAD